MFSPMPSIGALTSKVGPWSGRGIGVALVLARGAARITRLVFAVDDRILGFVGFFDAGAAPVQSFVELGGKLGLIGAGG